MMGYAAIPWYIVGGLFFFLPFAFMVTELGSAFKERKRWDLFLDGESSWSNFRLRRNIYVVRFIFGMDGQRFKWYHGTHHKHDFW